MQQIVDADSTSRNESLKATLFVALCGVNAASFVHGTDATLKFIIYAAYIESNRSLHRCLFGGYVRPGLAKSGHDSISGIPTKQIVIISIKTIRFTRSPPEGYFGKAGGIRRRKVFQTR